MYKFSVVVASLMTLVLSACGGGGGGGGSTDNPPINNNPIVISSSASSTATSSTTSVAASSMASSTASSIVSTTLPAAATVTVSYGIKQVVLKWTNATGATSYKVSKQATTGSGYSVVADNYNENVYWEQISVHLADWVNMTYIVDACNTSGCTPSAVISALDSTKAIGYFKASNTGKDDHFGASIALSSDGSTMAVGAWGEDSSSDVINDGETSNSESAAGAVYVFVRDSNIDNGKWKQQAYIKASNSDAGDRFGESIALSGDGNTLIVGASGEDSNATLINGSETYNGMANSGAAYVFTRTNTAWTKQAFIKASVSHTADLFGSSIALSTDGNSLAIGATGDTTNTGKVHTYTRSGSTWTWQTSLVASTPATSDYFGFSLAMSGDGKTLAVGAYGEDSNATGVNGSQTNNSSTNSGALYVFVNNSNLWSQQAYIKASDTGTEDRFGYATALSNDGNTLAVGAPSNASGIGAAYVFSRTSTTWMQQGSPIKASSTAVDASFGGSVSLTGDGNTLVVAASREDNSATGVNGNQNNGTEAESGAAYVFTRATNLWTQKSYIKASNTGADDTFGTPVVVSNDGSMLVVGADFEDSNATGVDGDQTNNLLTESGAVYIY